MGSPHARVLVAALALVVAAALFFVLRDNDDDDSSSDTTTPVAQTTTTIATSEESEQKPNPPPESRIPLIEVVNGEPKGGVAELTFAKGEEIRFVVTSDVADHVHLHGYDLFQDVAAGGKAEFSVPATIEGVFEVELEDRVVPLAEITVEPG
jgi:hypothetical protein